MGLSKQLGFRELAQKKKGNIRNTSGIIRTFRSSNKNDFKGFEELFGIQAESLQQFDRLTDKKDVEGLQGIPAVEPPEHLSDSTNKNYFKEFERNYKECKRNHPNISMAQPIIRWPQ